MYIYLLLYLLNCLGCGSEQYLTFKSEHKKYFQRTYWLV